MVRDRESRVQIAGPDQHDYSGLVPLGAVTILIRTTRPQPITAHTTIATSEALSKVLVFVPVSPKIPVNGATINPLS